MSVGWKNQQRQSLGDPCGESWPCHDTLNECLDRYDSNQKSALLGMPLPERMTEGCSGWLYQKQLINLRLSKMDRFGYHRQQGCFCGGPAQEGSSFKWTQWSGSQLLFQWSWTETGERRAGDSFPLECDWGGIFELSCHLSQFECGWKDAAGEGRVDNVSDRRGDGGSYCL